MHVLITSKDTFDTLMEMRGITNDNVEQHNQTCFISINDPQGTPEVPYFTEHANVKVLFFHDLEEDVEHPKYGTLKAFTMDQARELCDFILNNKDKTNCIVHCAAGVSRSGAVGTFINDFFKGDLYEFHKRNPYIHPNAHVLRLLKNAAIEKLD